MDLSIITVTWNNESTITDQIRSVISACKDISYEHIIVDNASSDKTRERINATGAAVTLIANKTNDGFAAGNNIGARKVQGRYILLLNPDMKLTPGSLGRLVSWMDKNEDVIISSCRLTGADGTYNAEAGPRRFPTILNQLALILKLPHLFPSVMDSYMMRDVNPEEEHAVDSVRGAFLLTRKSFVEELGWVLDPRYPNWFEDVDVCREAKERGYRVVYTPVVSCEDLVGKSFSQRSALQNQRQFTKSMLIYFRKWEPWYKWIWIALARPIGVGLTLLFARKRK